MTSHELRYGGRIGSPNSAADKRARAAVTAGLVLKPNGEYGLHPDDVVKKDRVAPAAGRSATGRGVWFNEIDVTGAKLGDVQISNFAPNLDEWRSSTDRSNVVDVNFRHSETPEPQASYGEEQPKRAVNQ